MMSNFTEYSSSHSLESTPVDELDCDLSGRILTEIPDDVLQKCDHIRSLNLDGNTRIKLHNCLKRFKSLTKLSLSKCFLRIIPDAIFELSTLADVDLSFNDLSSGLNEAVERLVCLKKLNLSYSNLNGLPECIGNLKELEDVDLSMNDLSRGRYDAMGRLVRLKKLKLRKCKLDGVPNWIWNLEQLEDVDLSENDLSSSQHSCNKMLVCIEPHTYSWDMENRLPDRTRSRSQFPDDDLSTHNLSSSLKEQLGRLVHLKKLQLSQCKLHSLPEWIGYLEQLEEVDLSYNDLYWGLNDTMTSLVRLKKLEVQSCNLKGLPDWIGNLEQLEDINLRKNDFSSGLNKAMTHLVRLKRLNLYDCKLNGFPDWIGNLEQLVDVDLSFNDLSSGINDVMARLVRLKKLTLYYCKLKSLPNWIENLEQLEDVDLRSNDLSSGLIDAMARLSRLKKLKVGGCKLNGLPGWIKNLEQLEHVDLSKNDSSTGLFDAMGDVARLRKLQLRDCKLNGLPDWIGKLEQLEEVDLSENDLSSCRTDHMTRVVHLKKLQLWRCKLKVLPDWIGNLTQLSDLDLSDNDFSGGLNAAIGRLCRLKTLNISDCNLNGLPKWIGNLEQLEDVRLSENDLSRGQYDAMGCLVRLKKLHLSYCNVRSVPHWIGNLKQLEYVNLSENDFSRGLNDAMGCLVRLKELNLWDCELKVLPEWIGNLEQLEVLNLDDNNLRAYPECTLKLKRLQKLYLSYSNTCRCGNKYYTGNGDYKKRTSNRITLLPLGLAFTNLRELSLDGNPIKEPPKAIWSQGVDAIKSFMRAVIPGGELRLADTLNMVGDTGAGKTSLARSLLARSPRPTAEDDRTRVLEQIPMPTDDRSGHSVIINDFGGHEVYQSVLPIFMPANGLAILVFDMTKENPEGTVRRWLLTTIAKSKEIRVIIVGTHTDVLEGDKRLLVEQKILQCIIEVWDETIQEVLHHLYFLPKDNNKKIEKLEKLLANLRNALVGFWQSAPDRMKALSAHLKNLSAAKPGHSDIIKLMEQVPESAGRSTVGEKANVAVRFVTLSCFKEDEGLTKLSDLVGELLRPPETLPVRWCKVINDIQTESLQPPFITMDRIKEICVLHFTADDDSNAIKTILRYLSSTSQIIWLENHTELDNLIFHSPQTIINVCKKLLYHEKALPKCIQDYEDEMKEYNKGYMSERLVQWLLVKEEDEFKVLPEHSGQTDIVLKLLQKFNIISCVAPQSNRDECAKKYIVPCKLSPTSPQERLQKLEKDGKDCLNRVVVRLSFTGFVVPLSGFETSLAAMLTIAYDLANQEVRPQVWRDGLIISHNGVNLVAELRNSVITLTAFSESSYPSPWTLLHPVLKHLHSNVTGLWYGAPPRCSIDCPSCVRRSGSQLRKSQHQIGNIIAQNVEALLVIKESGGLLHCQTCGEFIPRALCFPTGSNGSFDKNQREIEEFFRKIDQKRSREWTSAECPSNFPRLSESETRLKKLRLATFDIASRLTEQEVKRISLKLYSMGCIILEECECIQSKAYATEKAAELLIILGKRNSSGVIQAFEKILQKIHRQDLASMLVPGSSDQS